MATVRLLVEEAYGLPFEQVFSEWDPEPIGAASIGQVHRATLAPTAPRLTGAPASDPASSTSRTLAGAQVVVKVQYPEVEGRFRGDVRTIKNFCKIAQPEHVKVGEVGGLNAVVKRSIRTAYGSVRPACLRLSRKSRSNSRPSSTTCMRRAT